ncbi:MAG: hypothetical protein ACKPKO_32720, partial [Candidatus Fonsibacter sp.]
HVGAAVALIERIKSGESYTWANNCQNVGPLEASLMKLKDAMASFDKEFIIQDPKTMLAKVGQGKWLGLLVHSTTARPSSVSCPPSPNISL